MSYYVSHSGLPDGREFPVRPRKCLRFFFRLLNRRLAHATVVAQMARTHEDIQDELLVLHCQDGDAAALKSLIERWQPRLTRLAWRLTADRESAHDIVQDAWLSIVRGLSRLDDPASFRAWAYRIVKNKCADWVRRRVVRREAAEEIRETAVDAANDERCESESDEVDALRQALAAMPDEQRAILSLHYLDGMLLAEIAMVFGVPLGTVKSRLHHARSKLKQTLERVKP